MIRLEPGDEAPPAARRPALQLLEAHEGRHLVGIAAHALRHQVRPHHVGVGGDIEQPPVRLQPPEEPV
jgi:hypothetical protein